MERGNFSRNSVAKGLAELEYFTWIRGHRNIGGVTNYEFTYPALFNANGKEILNQPWPSKEWASHWALEHRRVKNKKDFS